MTVDLHVHVVVPELLRDVAPNEAWRPSIRWQDGAQVVENGGRELRSALREFVDLERILAEQDAVGIDRVVLCPWVPMLFLEAEPQAALERARIQNASLAAMVRQAPERVSALGAVPLQDPELAAAELRALMAGGVLAGVEIAASVGGDYLGHPRFEPFWDAAEETGALVFIHPTTLGLGVDALRDHYLWNTVGNPLETTITAAHMVMSGLLERHPRLRVLLAHAGGALLWLSGRIAHSHGFQPQARARLSEPPLASMRRFFYDTITHDPQVLRSVIDVVGPEQVVLGSDYPFDMGDERPADTVRALGLDPAAEAAILAGNAERLLGLAATRTTQETRA